jgi:hypothetical protein
MCPECAESGLLGTSAIDNTPILLVGMPVREVRMPPSTGGVEFSRLAKNRAIDFTAVFRFIPKKYIFK